MRSTYGMERTTFADQRELLAALGAAQPAKRCDMTAAAPMTQLSCHGTSIVGE
eukprot:gene20397-21469_t